MHEKCQESEMNTYSTATLPAPISTIQRRGVGRTEWKRVIDEIIASEREDMRDMAILRRLLHGNAEGQQLIAQMQERKTRRVDELNSLYHYKEAKAKDKPEEEPLYPRG